VDNALFFAAETPATGRELWISDGTADGTRLVIDLVPGPSGSNPYSMTPYRDGLLFSGDHDRYGEELWFTDGTTGGTRLVRDINPGLADAEPYHLTVFDGLVWFEANDGRHGNELWRSDGTTEGTFIACDFTQPKHAPPGSTPQQLTTSGSDAWFVAQDRDRKWYLWHTRGTVGDVRRLNPEIAQGRAEYFRAILPFSGGVYVVTSSSHVGTLWFATPEDVALVKEAPPVLYDDNGRCSVASLGTKFFFAGRTESGQAAIYLLTEPCAAAQLVDTGGADLSSALPRELTPWGDQVAFVASSPDTGEELWIIDGMAARLLADITPGPGSGFPRSLLPAHGGLYFVGDDGVHGPEVWHTEGETHDTRRLTDINPVQDPSAIPPAELTCIGQTLFFSAHEPIHGTELWAYTVGATAPRLVRDIFYGPASSYPAELTPVGPHIYFRAESLNKGTELWTSDGTKEGTRLITDLVEGQGSSGPHLLTSAGNRLLFAARSERDAKPAEPVQLWWTDGVRFDVALNNRCTGPYEVALLKEGILCSRQDALYGHELYTGYFDESTGSLGIHLLADLQPPPSPTFFTAPQLP
jgi:ELWxxDGT repeat protein